MPLLDTTAGEPPVLAFIDYSDESEAYMRAYRWNEKKWNGTSIRPSRWKPDETRTSIEGDRITSYVLSTVKALGTEVSTKTEFSFKTENGRKYLYFTNKGEGENASFVNMGLLANRNPVEGTDKYTFVLSKIDEGGMGL